MANTIDISALGDRASLAAALAQAAMHSEPMTIILTEEQRTAHDEDKDVPIPVPVKEGEEPKLPVMARMRGEKNVRDEEVVQLDGHAVGSVALRIATKEGK